MVFFPPFSNSCSSHNIIPCDSIIRLTEVSAALHILRRTTNLVVISICWIRQRHGKVLLLCVQRHSPCKIVLGEITSQSDLLWHSPYKGSNYFTVQSAIRVTIISQSDLLRDSPHKSCKQLFHNYYSGDLQLKYVIAYSIDIWQHYLHLYDVLTRIRLSGWQVR